MAAHPASGRRTALVTGAAQGLGAAIAIALAREGYDLALTSTRASTLAHTIEAVQGAGARALGVALDLAEVSAIEPALAHIASALELPDTLINNAGVNIRSWARETSAEQWRSTLGINLKGPFFLTQALARRWVEAAQGGVIVNIASTHG